MRPKPAPTPPPLKSLPPLLMRTWTWTLAWVDSTVAMFCQVGGLVSLLLQCGIRDSHCISYCEHGALRCFHSVHDSSNHPSEVFSWKIGSRAFSQDFCPITALIETHCFWKERLDFGRICSGMMRIGGGCIKPTGILTPHLLVTTHYPCSICNVMPFIFTLQNWINLYDCALHTCTVHNVQKMCCKTFWVKIKKNCKQQLHCISLI